MLRAHPMTSAPAHLSGQAKHEWEANAVLQNLAALGDQDEVPLHFPEADRQLTLWGVLVARGEEHAADHHAQDEQAAKATRGAQACGRRSPRLALQPTSRELHEAFSGSRAEASDMQTGEVHAGASHLSCDAEGKS